LETERWNPNPWGRPVGSRNRRDAAIWEKLESRGDKDPAEFLSELVSNQNEPKELRAQAANYLMPYKYSKRGATPVPPEPTYWNVDVRITQAVTVTQGRENLQFISDLKLQGRISEQQADSLSAAHCKILDGLVEEQKLLTAQGGPLKQEIIISGGLPTMPGHENLIMPEMNGLNGHAIEGMPQPETKSIPEQTPRQSSGESSSPTKDGEP
jgi:hypothetical protein